MNLEELGYIKVEDSSFDTLYKKKDCKYKHEKIYEHIIFYKKNDGTYYSYEKFTNGYDCEDNEIDELREISLKEHIAIGKIFQKNEKMKEDKKMKTFNLRANKDFTNIAIDFTNHEEKWVTESIYKDVDNEEIPAWKILQEINKLMYLGYKSKSIVAIIEQSNVEKLNFL